MAAHQAPRPWDSPGKNTGVGCHFLLQCMKGKSESEVAQSCPTLHDPMDRSPPGSSVHGILQARVPEWGAITFSTKLHQQPLKPEAMQGLIPVTEDQFPQALTIPCASPCNTWSQQSRNPVGGDGNLT